MKTTVSLNPKQQDLLELIAKYRFITIANVQTFYGLKSRGGVHEKLSVLVKSGHLAFRYDRDYKFRYRAGSYYLTPKGLRAIQDSTPYITDATIRGAYADKNASEQLLDASNTVFEMVQNLTRLYPGMKAFTPRQLSGFDYFPKPLPDLYLAHIKEDETNRYFLYHLRDGKRYDVAVNARARQLIAYVESNQYAESGNDFPVVLFVCDTPAIERLAGRLTRSLLNKSYESMSVYTSSTGALLQQQTTDEAIWSSLETPDELIALEQAR